jgi:predicted metal-dependent HD superfamily phosphohydrolase
MENQRTMQHMWEQLLQMFGVGQIEAQATCAALVHAYSSPGRVYHTLEHIQAVLTWIELLHDYTTDLPALQLAAWFHDCIYDPHAADNEEQSAVYAQNMLTSLVLPAPTIQAVSQMILSTKTHVAEANQQDCHILLDADLAILGATVQQYDAYAQAIRQEYSWVPETAYKTGRAQVLHTFLQRARIYSTEFMHTALEVPARENMRRELASLLG